MSKGQFESVGGRRGPESGYIAPEDVTIIEMVDEAHPRHAFYSQRLSPTDPDILALAASMREIGWATGSVAFLYRDGQKGPIAAATARRRITAARIENERRAREKDKRGPIEVPCLMTRDPVTAEAVENAGRVNLPPMQLAREFVALKEAFGDGAQAAARLVIPLATANALERCLLLPADIQGKVNRLEIPVDVALRMAKAGSAVAREVASAATDASGKVDPKRAKAAAREAVPVRAKTRPARVLASVEGELRRMGGDAPDIDYASARMHDAADVLAYARGATDAPAWLAKAIESAEVARKARAT